MNGADFAVLCELRLDDAEAMFAYRSDPDVARYQCWEPESPDEVRSFIDGVLKSDAFVPGTWYQLGIALRSSGELIGDCGVRVLPDDPRQAEFGITVAPAYQGRGHASQALRALLTVLFDDLGKHRVYGSVDPRNAASIALMLRAGFRQEAHLRESIWFKGEWADDVIFAMLRREWLARAAPQSPP
ncbi:MAG: N-acetyltransferase [Candidatus Eremiobacteraeota bacterium]|nr:N-acetyltransferase [Candidatus Eremiobacteraeota bacterium]